MRHYPAWSRTRKAGKAIAAFLIVMLSASVGLFASGAPESRLSVSAIPYSTDFTVYPGEKLADYSHNAFGMNLGYQFITRHGFTIGAEGGFRRAGYDAGELWSYPVLGNLGWTFRIGDSKLQVLGAAGAQFQQMDNGWTWDWAFGGRVGLSLPIAQDWDFDLGAGVIWHNGSRIQSPGMTDRWEISVPVTVGVSFRIPTERDRVKPAPSCVQAEPAEAAAESPVPADEPADIPALINISDSVFFFSSGNDMSTSSIDTALAVLAASSSADEPAEPTVIVSEKKIAAVPEKAAAEEDAAASNAQEPEEEPFTLSEVMAYPEGLPLTDRIVENAGRMIKDKDTFGILYIRTYNPDGTYEGQGYLTAAALNSEGKSELVMKRPVSDDDFDRLLAAADMGRLSRP